ncbi:hypothetical protein [Snodgrassella sp. CFCC 13594]|uniref:hypothetical protein n=1 Tax=Snodgrassella sp. CFCC 13594 TaxID=1775559 RepID=UPI000AC7B151|nr:hypothetical protein [Snodgrassella sp. CFCC 13594]
MGTTNVSGLVKTIGEWLIKPIPLSDDATNGQYNWQHISEEQEKAQIKLHAG